MQYDVPTLDDRPGEGTYLVRIDVNSPLDDDGRPTARSRFEAHLPTLDELSGSAIAVLAHQGRPGRPDCVSLAPHAEILDELLDRPVDHVPDLFGAEARRAVEDLERGSVLVLENTRMYPEEKRDPGPDNPIVRNLAPRVDGYVNDAFAAAHRGDTSLVGFPPRIWSAAGRLIVDEMEALSRAIEEPARPAVVVLGGAKVDDALDVAGRMLDGGRADRVLAGGALANLLLQADGTSIGAPNWGFIQNQVPDANQLLKEAERLLGTHGEKVERPGDVAISEDGERVEADLEALPATDPIYDLGPATIARYEEIVASAGTVVVNGPMGVYEHPSFREGTEAVFDAIAASGAYSVAGGGHTSEALAELGIGGFDHVSTGGGASLAYLSGREMPALAALSAGRDES